MAKVLATADLENGERVELVESEAVSLSQAAFVLGKDRGSVKRLVEIGRLPALRVEGRLVVTTDSLEDYLRAEWASLAGYFSQKGLHKVEEALRGTDPTRYMQERLQAWVRTQSERANRD
jgi:hypothetical protein